jgi:hypothetical protein
MLRKLAIAAGVLAVVVAGLLVYAATQPDDFVVARTASIKAPPERIYPLVSDLRRHREWSPWERKDPEMKRLYTGASSGAGAVYEWDGNGEIGAGRMTIAESSPQRVVFDMHFLRPFDSRSTAEIVMQPRALGTGGDTTEVTWSIHGPKLFIAKVLSVFCDIDAMIGQEFESGLATLKSVTEAAS